jgi:hypothetical protein
LHHFCHPQVIKSSFKYDVFRWKIQIPTDIFAAMNFKKKIKDDYSEKLAELLEKVQSGVFYFHEILAGNMFANFLLVL